MLGRQIPEEHDSTDGDKELNIHIMNRVRNTSSVIADHLREKIQKNELKPGQRLVQEDLATSYGVSRVAIRDALHKLKQKGLAIDDKRRGTIVRPVSGKAVRELYVLRSLLEPFLIGEVCNVIKDNEIKELKKINKEIKQISIEKDSEKCIIKDWQFHLYMYSRTSSSLFIEILELIWARLSQARSIVNQDTDWLRDWATRTVKHHDELIELLEKKKPEEIGRKMKQIIIEAGDKISKQLEERGWPE